MVHLMLMLSLPSLQPAPVQVWVQTPLLSPERPPEQPSSETFGDGHLAT